MGMASIFGPNWGRVPRPFSGTKHKAPPASGPAGALSAAGYPAMGIASTPAGRVVTGAFVVWTELVST